MAIGMHWPTPVFSYKRWPRTPALAKRHQSQGVSVRHAPNCFYDASGLLAAIHATSVLGTGDSMIEWRRFDLEAQLYGGALVPENGRISAPEGPGLGVDADPDVIRAYLRH